MNPGRLLAAAGSGLVLAAGGVAVFLRRSLPQTRGTVRLSGLKGEVEVIRDRWGVPHIYADSAQDLFFAQGYVHAQDRLWQMEFQRRLAGGRLSEVVGEATLDIDRAFRILGLYRAAEQDVQVLDDESRRVLDAYAAGVNACIASRKGRLPAEFSLLRFKPEPWRPADSLCWLKVMAWNMGSNWASELIRARLAAKLGADLAADLEPPYPADNPATVPGHGLAAGAEPPPNGWGSEALREALRQVEPLFRPGAAAPRRTPPPPLAQAAGNSNQWAVSGDRSASGWPLLANDTHLLLQMPTAWYQTHLTGGGYDVTGVSLPGIPVVAVGHNEHCAWGITIAWQDAQDLYIEKLNPENPHQYEYRGEWLDAKVVREEIRVKGRAEPVVEEVVITQHGPIISTLAGEETPLALHWVGLEPGNPVPAFLRLNRAGNWDEFRAALSDWAAPSLNFGYADRLGERGNIGFVQAGRVPVRARGYGLVPVPGWSGEYEWLGYLALDELPQAYNPDSGWLATSNNLVVDGSYPHFISADLENPCRARRAVDLITATDQLPAGKLGADDCARFQLDTYSRQAERFVQHLLAIKAESEAEQRALAYLQEWDAHLEPGSVAASLYQVCRLQALHLVFDGHLGDLAGVYVGAEGLTPLGETSPYHGRSIVRLLNLLDGKGSDYWLRDPATGRQRSPRGILHQALREALDLLAAEFGAEMEHWTWGRLSRVHFAHPLGAVKPLHLLFNRGPYPMGGDQDTLLRASGKPEFPFGPAQVLDALRFVADLSDWEQCRIVIPGGQSGHAASRHYADLIPPWREGRLQAMPFRRDQVERHAESRLLLVPEPEAPGQKP
jgi:penicillin amidase